MGASLSARFEWTGAPLAEGATGGQLQTSVQNQELLYELVSMIAQLCQKNIPESKAEFKRPIQWTSSLSPSQFPNSKVASLFNVQFSNSKYDLLFYQSLIVIGILNQL